MNVFLLWNSMDSDYVNMIYVYKGFDKRIICHLEI